jgi:hypothetical protein
LQIEALADAVIYIEHWKDQHPDFEEMIRTAPPEDLQEARTRAAEKEPDRHPGVISMNRTTLVLLRQIAGNKFSGLSQLHTRRETPAEITDSA